MVQTDTKQVLLPVQIKQETTDTFTPPNLRFLRPRQAWKEQGAAEIPAWKKKECKKYIPWQVFERYGRLVGGRLQISNIDKIRKSTKNPSNLTDTSIQ